jgi:hypothetical protein
MHYFQTYVIFFLFIYYQYEGNFSNATALITVDFIGLYKEDLLKYISALTRSLASKYYMKITVPRLEIFYNKIIHLFTSILINIHRMEEEMNFKKNF